MYNIEAPLCHSVTNHSHGIGEKDSKDVFMLALYGSLQWSEASRVLRIGVGMVVEEETGYPRHALARPRSLLHCHRGDCSQCLQMQRWGEGEGIDIVFMEGE